MYVVALASLALLWGFAHSAGLVDNFEGFMSDVGFENWRFYGEEIFRRCAIIGAILVLTGALLTTLATALLNVISELTGGIRVVVIEEVPLPAPAPAAAPAPSAIPPRPRRRPCPASPPAAPAAPSRAGPDRPGGGSRRLSGRGLRSPRRRRFAPLGGLESSVGPGAIAQSVRAHP